MSQGDEKLIIFAPLERETFRTFGLLRHIEGALLALSVELTNKLPWAISRVCVSPLEFY